MIIPKPISVSQAAGEFEFNDQITVCLSFTKDLGYSYFVAEELAQRLRVVSGVFVSVKELSPGDAPRGSVVLTDQDADPGLGKEGYALSVCPDRITLNAGTKAGLFYAAQSLYQLLYSAKHQAAGGNGQQTIRSIPCVMIKDQPRFGWRGFMLDSARHYQPLDLIYRLIDQMAALKLNRFHWHLTEDQGWRLEILGYPRLTEFGAWRNTDQGRYGGYYTQEDVRGLVTYAQMRNIEIIPEIEIPAHSLAALASYPELSCHKNEIDVPTKWGLLDGVFCASQDQTYQFLHNVFEEVAEMFPAGYLHLGGDERKPGVWDSCPGCVKLREEQGLEDEAQLQKWFMGKVSEHVHTQMKRRTIAWGDNIDAGGNEGQIVQGWKEGQAAKAARQGLSTINSDNLWVYFDYPHSAEEAEALSRPSWMKVLPMEKVYRFDPIPEDLEPKFHKHILGSEAPLWTEQVPDEATIYRQINPRLIAFAEAVWLPQDQKDLEDFQGRLDVLQPYVFGN